MKNRTFSLGNFVVCYGKYWDDYEDMLSVGEAFANMLFNNGFISGKTYVLNAYLVNVELNHLNTIDRGLMMIKFMENQYDFIVPNRADRIKMLGLDFMINEEDLYQDATASIQEETEKYPDLEDELFLKVDGVTYGIGYYKGNKLIVKSGSKLRENIVAADENMREKVKKYRDNPKIFEGMYIADEEYSSPSLAANVILGNNKNGWTMWKNKDDVTLDELIRNKTE